MPQGPKAICPPTPRWPIIPPLIIALRKKTQVSGVDIEMDELSHPNNYIIYFRKNSEKMTNKSEKNRRFIELLIGL